MLSKVAELSQIIEDMKCCANCKYADIEKEFEIHNKIFCINNDTEHEFVYPNEVCKKWEQDNLSYYERDMQCQ